MASKIDLRGFIASPAEFRRALIIDTDGGPRPLADVADAWQLKDFAALDDGWRRVAGWNVTGKQRAYLERPRGHSKTGDLACMVAWVLLASRKRLSGVAAAADRDQAGLLRDAISKLCLKLILAYIKFIHTGIGKHINGCGIICLTIITLCHDRQTTDGNHWNIDRKSERFCG